MAETLAGLAAAAKRADWMQVALNVMGGAKQVCFHLEPDGDFCLRAELWDGHENADYPFHKFVSLADALTPHIERAEKLRKAGETLADAAKDLDDALSKIGLYGEIDVTLHHNLARALAAWRALTAEEPSK